MTVHHSEPVEFGMKVRDLRGVYEMGGIVGVISFLEDMPDDEVRTLTAYLIGYLQEIND